MSKVHVYSNGACFCSVCAPASLSMDEVTKQVNIENPTGLDHGWKLSKDDFKDGTKNGSKCKSYDSHNHYLFEC